MSAKKKNWTQLWPKSRQVPLQLQLQSGRNYITVSISLRWLMANWVARSLHDRSDRTETKAAASGYMPVNEAGCCCCWLVWISHNALSNGPTVIGNSLALYWPIRPIASQLSSVGCRLTWPRCCICRRRSPVAVSLHSRWPRCGESSDTCVSWQLENRSLLQLLQLHSHDHWGKTAPKWLSSGLRP